MIMTERPTRTTPETFHRAPGGTGLELDTAALALVTKALADPSRIKILQLLTRENCNCRGGAALLDPEGGQATAGVCICDLVAETGLIQSLVSYHMKILREAGLVHEQPRGKWKHYRINTDTVNAFLAAWSSILLNS